MFIAVPNVPLKGVVKQHNNCSNGDKGTPLQTIFFVRHSMLHSFVHTKVPVIAKRMKNESLSEKFKLLTFSPPHT